MTVLIITLDVRRKSQAFYNGIKKGKCTSF